MRVIAKYKSVEVIYPDGRTNVVSCLSVHDANEYRDRLLKVIPYRERAKKDSDYLNEFYQYLKNKGYIEKSLYQSQQALIRKASLLRQVSQHWV